MGRPTCSAWPTVSGRSGWRERRGRRPPQGPERCPVEQVEKAVAIRPEDAHRARGRDQRGLERVEDLARHVRRDRPPGYPLGDLRQRRAQINDLGNGLERITVWPKGARRSGYSPVFPMP